MQSAPILQPGSLNLPPMARTQLSSASSEEVATEFESLVIAQLLKQMRSDSSDGGMFPGDKSDTYGGMFDLYFGKFLAENGGLGLADHVQSGLQQLTRT